MLNPEAQKILDSYSPQEQKRWKANPLLTFILRSYENQLIANLSKGGSTVQSKAKEVVKEVKVEKEVEKDVSDDDDGDMFSMFD